MILILNALKILLSEEDGSGLDQNSMCFVIMDHELKSGNEDTVFFLVTRDVVSI
jgi:hypothetical protein